MWWTYLVGSVFCGIFTIWLIIQQNADWFFTFIGCVWLLNSARVAYCEDKKDNP